MAIPLGDTEYGYWRDHLMLETTIEQDLACVKLETKYSQRFLVDFGYQNAIEKLRDARRAELISGEGPA